MFSCLEGTPHGATNFVTFPLAASLPFMATRDFSMTVVRPDDLLLFRLHFVNVDDTVSGQAGGGADSRLIVHFQPQHVAEQAFFEGPPPETPLPPGQVGSRMAGPSRLAFRIPPGDHVDLTLPGVLAALKRLPLIVTAVARYERPAAFGCLGGLFAPLKLLSLALPPKIVAPGRFETAIEAPYRLVLSPDAEGSWDHSDKAVKPDGRIELWHTRLGSRRESKDPRVRAVWSPDFQATLQDPDSPPFHPFRTSLDARDRNQIVHSTSDFHIDNFTPDPVKTERLMLTTLGAWIDVRGEWKSPFGFSLEGWRHVATMGRDHFVRVVVAGYLLPFGHRASFVKVTERKFVRDLQRPGFIAYDLQRFFIIVREPRRGYDTRDLPFRSVEILTRVTPDLAEPILIEGFPAFWPRFAPAPGMPIVEFPFQLAGTDWEGRRIELTAPLIFIEKTAEENATQRGKVVDAYNALDVENPLRKRPFAGQPIAFAISKESGDTTLEAQSISFGAAAVPAAAPPPHFRPVMAQAHVDIPAVQQLTNSSAASRIGWESSYVTNGTGTAIGNAANIFARVTSKADLTFAAQQSGGLATPDLTITALSRSLGPVGGNVDKMVQPLGEFDPADVFGKHAEPQVLPLVELMGGIALSDIIRPLQFTNAASTAGAIPQLRTIRDGNLITTRYLWSLTRDQIRDDSKIFIPQPGTTFLLESEVQKHLDSTAPPTFRSKGMLTNFGVLILPDTPLVRIDFNSVSFTAEPGKKPDTSVELKGLKFLGILEFVDKLRELIPADGFSDPPSLEVGSDGIRVGFSVGIPTVGVGIMTMQNLSLSAGFFLPFTKQPMNFRFAFCERQQPFILTVSGLGGGGFVAVNIGLHGVTSLEASLEFGASVALNLGVAAGAATIMAGFYFQMAEGGNFQLTGYLRACGELSVLGIISVCVELYLGLSYSGKGTSHPNALWGQASLTVKIKIAFFSKSVGVSMEREFAGSDPLFLDVLEPPDWKLYCDAFGDYAGVGGA
jgi:hypothetical protein